MSAIGADCGWKLMGHSATGDAVETALMCHSQGVRYGSRCFEFSQTRVPSGEIVLKLRESGCLPEAGGTPPSPEPTRRSLQVERRVSAVSRHLGEATRARVEAKVVRAVGRALFGHVAHLVDAEEA